MTKTKITQDNADQEIIKTPNSPKSILNKLMEEEKKVVKGRFRCYETPGGSTRIQIKKYKELPMFDKTMVDNEVYEVPLYVARHLNGIDATARSLNGKVNTCSYPIHGFTWKDNIPPTSSEGRGPNGEGGIPVPLVGIAKRVRRYGFESLEFGEAV